MRSPRPERSRGSSGQRARPLLQFPHRYVDPDFVSDDSRDDVCDVLRNETTADSSGPGSTALRPLNSFPAMVGSPRQLHAQRETFLAKDNGSPRLAGAASFPSPPKSSSPRRKMPPLFRPHSPMGDVPPASVVTSQVLREHIPGASPRSNKKVILTSSDASKITAWLQSLEAETASFSSYSLYCEMLFRESAALTRGKPTPNRLQTAIAIHCLCKATSVFARHEGILVKICADLSAAIYMNPEDLPAATAPHEMDALECFAQQLTYYEHQHLLHQQRVAMEADMEKERSQYKSRLKEEEARVAKLKDIETRFNIKAIDQISHRNTAHDELGEKLSAVLRHFQYMGEQEKQHVVLQVINALRAHLTADTLVQITNEMSLYEKDKVLRQLFKEDIQDMTDKIRSDFLLSSSVQQNAILERSASRITRFQALISSLLKNNRPSTAVSKEEEGPPPLNLARAMMDDDLCDQDRKLLECVNDAMEELQLERKKNAELQQQLLEADQLTTNLRWKNNAQLNEAQEAALAHAKEVQELRAELMKASPVLVEQAVQTDRQQRSRDGNTDDDNDEYEDDEDSKTGLTGKGRGRRRGGGQNSQEDDLIIKNRRTNKYGFGIASIIDQAKIPSSKIRKILSKRKPLTLSELHSIIVGYYQAKMIQDDQDDNAAKLRNNLAQFIMEMYVLHYGLKDLAISQLVFLDAAIRKHARESARVRIFGLLTGSLDPESHACSVQGIDFFLFVVVVIFNVCNILAGVYKKGRKQATAIAQKLRTAFGDGIFLSSKSVSVKTEIVCETIDRVFSYTKEDSNETLDKLKEEINLLCASQTTATGVVGLDIDIALEKIMNYWFVLYEQQIHDIHDMFGTVDTNGDGTLDFREFCELVVVLEPNIDRREALVLYNRAAGEDQVIDKDEFVQVMLSYQRRVILKEFYGSDASRKASSVVSSRKTVVQFSGIGGASAGPPSPGPVEYQSLSGALAQLDREESYASLAAAMSHVTNLPTGERESPVVEEDDQDDEGDDTMSPLNQTSTDGPRTDESISFMTLSRLSLWAGEAKNKLMTIRRPKSSTPVAPEPPAPRPVTKPQLIPDLIEDDVDKFEFDVDNLLRVALSKANIDIDGIL